MKITDALIQRARPLLEFIKQPESLGDYNIVWGGIKPRDHPPKPLTSMTIGQVLDWQDSIDRRYMSEAAGAYQIMEDTLRGLHETADLGKHELYNEANQDRLAVALLIRRGYLKYLDGLLSTEGFANALAKEWASLPVVSGPDKGRSYYAGDSLNKAHVGVDDFLDAVAASRAETVAHDDPAEQSEHWLIRLLKWLIEALEGRA